MEQIKTLFERTQPAEPRLPAALRDLYGGDLHFPAPFGSRPYVIGNFVSTLDGVVSYKLPGNSGGEAISGSDDGDRFIMGLLRASVDAVIVGSKTVHEVSRKHLWIPEFVYPGCKESYSDYRVNELHKPEHPLVVIVTRSGKLELGRAIFRTPDVRTLIITSAAGANELANRGVQKLGLVEVSTVAEAGSSIEPGAMLRLLFSKFGVRVLLHEGGPTLFGAFLAAALVDELFITMAPQIAGRLPSTSRPGLVEGVEFLPGAAPWFQLLTVKRYAENLYLRYRAQPKP
jgi:riboflavin biosynthesis pyrimidine reductase